MSIVSCHVVRVVLLVVSGLLHFHTVACLLIFAFTFSLFFWFLFVAVWLTYDSFMLDTSTSSSNSSNDCSSDNIFSENCRILAESDDSSDEDDEDDMSFKLDGKETTAETSLDFKDATTTRGLELLKLKLKNLVCQKRGGDERRGEGRRGGEEGKERRGEERRREEERRGR